MKVDELPEKVKYPDGDCPFEVAGDGSSLEVEYDVFDGFAGSHAHVWLTPSGVQAVADRGHCMGFWSGEHLAGAACLVTDGRSALLEFEIYDGGRPEQIGECLRLRADLGARGAQLARQVVPVPDADAVHRERVEFSLTADPFAARSEPRVEYEAFGLVDALGRRQGIWTVRPLGKASPALEMSWRDGMPDGFYRREDEYYRSEFGRFEAGFREGQVVAWTETGDRDVSEYHHGFLIRTTEYAADGTKVHDEKHTSYSWDPEVYWKQVHQSYLRRP